MGTVKGHHHPRRDRSLRVAIALEQFFSYKHSCLCSHFMWPHYNSRSHVSLIVELHVRCINNNDRGVHSWMLKEGDFGPVPGLEVQRPPLLERHNACNGRSANVAVVPDELLGLIQMEMQVGNHGRLERESMKASAGDIIDIAILCGGAHRRLLIV